MTAYTYPSPINFQFICNLFSLSVYIFISIPSLHASYRQNRQFSCTYIHMYRCMKIAQSAAVIALISQKSQMCIFVYRNCVGVGVYVFNTLRVLCASILWTFVLHIISNTLNFYIFLRKEHMPTHIQHIAIFANTAGTLSWIVKIQLQLQ